MDKADAAGGHAACESRGRHRVQHLEDLKSVLAIISEFEPGTRQWSSRTWTGGAVPHAESLDVPMPEEVSGVSIREVWAASDGGGTVDGGLWDARDLHGRHDQAVKAFGVDS